MSTLTFKVACAKPKYTVNLYGSQAPNMDPNYGNYMGLWYRINGGTYTFLASILTDTCEYLGSLVLYENDVLTVYVDDGEGNLGFDAALSSTCPTTNGGTYCDFPQTITSNIDIAVEVSNTPGFPYNTPIFCGV